MSIRVFGYIRVSSKKQVDGDGPERQTQAIAAFCKAQGLVLERTYSDSISGTVEGLDRPELAELFRFIDTMKELEQPAINGIVVERMDRLARDLMVSEVLLAECRKRGLIVYSADQGTLINMAEDGGDPTRVLIRQIMGALSQWEKTMLVRKLKSSRDRIRARGERCEGVKPYGHFRGEPEIIAIARALLPATNGEIARTLNLMQQGTRKGLQWTKDNVKKTLGPFLRL